MDRVRAQACQRGADAKANTIIGGGALEDGDHSLLEDGSERGGALVSDAVVPDTTRDVWGYSERAGACQRALTETQARGAAAHFFERGHGALVERLAELGDALGGVGAAPPGGDAAELIVDQAAKERRRVNGR